VIRLLREERIRKGLSKYAMAERSGLSEQMIGYVERGMRQPSLETTIRMASALDVDLGDILKRACKAISKEK
jgi:transcriptional regulator with XRE-family HTH domain